MSQQGLRVLDAARPGQREEWLALWGSWPEREPMAHPEYVQLFARPEDRVVCAAAGGPAGGVMYPLLLRPLASEPWAVGSMADAWDASTPYGYGGPFAWGERPASLDALWRPFHEWLAATSVVSSFARLSLFQEEMLPFPGEVVVRAPNVVRRLDLPLDGIWKSYSHKVRKNVNAARRAGLSVEFDAEGTRLDDFIAIYESTMERRQAGAGYYFPRSFFESIVRELGGSYLFAHVLHGDRVVSTELLLRSRRRLYSFLGGTRPDAFALRPNDLLKHEVTEWGHRLGLEAYVLGGGYGGPDGIFRYKLAFAPTGSVPFCVGTAVHDPEAYRVLVVARRAYEGERGKQWTPREDFFPEYRS